MRSSIMQVRRHGWLLASALTMGVHFLAASTAVAKPVDVAVVNSPTVQLAPGSTVEVTNSSTVELAPGSVVELAPGSVVGTVAAAPEVFRHTFQGPFDPFFGGSPYVNDTSKILLIELVTGRAADNALEVGLSVQGTGEAHFYQFPTRTLLPPPSNAIPGAIETFFLPVHELTRIYVLPGESLIPRRGDVLEVSGQFLP